MYNTIIVPVDMAHPGKADVMLAAAGKLANEGAKVVLTNIVEDVPMYVAAELPGGILEKSRQSAMAELEGLAKQANLKTEVEVRIGHPATSILAVAEEKGADCIIVASHRPGLQDYLLGSTAARVVRHASCSVHVMR